MLHWAAERQDLGLIRILIKSRAAVDIQVCFIVASVLLHPDSVGDLRLFGPVGFRIPFSYPEPDFDNELWYLYILECN